MKTIFVAIVALVIVSVTQAAVTITSEQKAKLSVYRKECIEQTGVDVETLKKPLQGDFPEDQKLKDFLLCVSKKAHFQNEAGEIQSGVIIEKLGKSISDPSKAKALTEKCIPHGGSPADITYDFVKCLYNSTPNHIFIFH